MNSGTLLGVTRDKRLIEHDDDLDLALVLKANTAAAAAKEWNELTATLRDQGIIDLKKTNSPSVLKLQGTGDLDIDLFPCWIEDGRIFVFPYSYGAWRRRIFSRCRLAPSLSIRSQRIRRRCWHKTMGLVGPHRIPISNFHGLKRAGNLSFSWMI